METELETVEPTENTGTVTENSRKKQLKRPAPVYNPALKKRRTTPHNPDDPDSDEDLEDLEETEEDDDDDDEEDDDGDDDETGGTGTLADSSSSSDDDDDDDDGETGSDTDGGEEDENELKQLDEENRNQKKTPENVIMAEHKRIAKKNTMKEKPKGPEKTERSPWQQMVDFFVHGVKGAMIKNGDMPTKVSMLDNILAGLGFKEFKREILLQEQAKQFWVQKTSGKKVDMRLLNTDLADKKIRAEEKREQMPLIRNERERISREKDAARLQKELADKITQQRRGDNIRQQITQQEKLYASNQKTIEQMRLQMEKALERENAVRVARNELTDKKPEQPKTQTQPTEMLKSSNEKVQESGAKDVKTVSFEQERINMIKETRETQQVQQTLKAKEINARDNDVANMMMAQRALEASQATQAANMANAALAAMGRPQPPQRPEIGQIAKQTQNIIAEQFKQEIATHHVQQNTREQANANTGVNTSTNANANTNANEKTLDNSSTTVSAPQLAKNAGGEMARVASTLLTNGATDVSKNESKQELMTPVENRSGNGRE